MVPPVPEESLSFAPLFFKTVVVTIFIIALAIFMLRYLVPRLSRRQKKNSNIDILDFQQLDARKMIFVVKIENKKVALGVTDHHISKICDLEP